MSYTISEKDGRIHIEFEKTNGSFNLKDAIVTSQSEYQSWSAEDIEKIIEIRWKNFLDSIEPEKLDEVIDVEVIDIPQGE
jgi:hypothetical protein